MTHRLPTTRIALAAAPLLLAAACASPPEPKPDLFSPSEAQMKIRSYQTRDFEVDSRNRAIRGVIAALQDLGFIIERANEPLGLVTAARFAEPDYYNVLEITVIVQPAGPGKMSIRANAIFNNKPIEDPKAYQSFFATLQRSMFIEAD